MVIDKRSSYSGKALLTIAALFVLYAEISKSETYNPDTKETIVQTMNSYPSFEDVIAQVLIRSNTRDEIVEKVNLILGNTNPDNIYYTTPGEGTAATQAAIDNPTKTVIYWTPGTYDNFASINDCYSLKPNKINILDAAIIDGLGPEHLKAYRIAEGGPVIVLGINGSLVKDFKDIAYIGNSQFDDILWEGLDGEFSRYGISMNNIEGSVPFTSAPVVLNLWTADGGIKFLKFNEGLGANEKSPYPGVFKSTIKNMSADNGAIDLTKYNFVLSMGGGVVLSTTVVRGQDEQEGNIFVNCNAPWDPNQYPLFSSPTRNGYKDVANPFIGDPNDDNLVIDGNDVYKDTLRPVMFRRLHNKDRSFRGALEPVATMDSVAYFMSCYLSDTNSPNWDPRADFDINDIVNLADFARVAEKYQI